jgi:hypothetical protein
VPRAPGFVADPLVRIPRDANQCWPWQGQLNTNGTPIKSWRGEPINARRWLWELLFGKLPDGYEVFTTCGIGDCANPAHLRCGTHAERCQAHATLSSWDVYEIRAVTPANRTRAHAEILATRFGVSATQVHNIWNKFTWAVRPRRKR